MNDPTTLQARMREATRLTMAGQLTQATALLRHALGDAPVRAPAASPKAPPASLVLDGLVFEVPSQHKPAQADRAAFIAGTHTHAGLTRGYKLYVPPGHAGKPLPLVVMLHGCTQDPDDFAEGTAMNERAREQGFFVLYPAQAQDANPSRCWNWFKHNHQQRGRGEPALIADLTRAVVEQYGMDAHRVYIAGLSAGGAMAAIAAQAYPEVFAAVGVHSGLPQGAAGNVAEALAVMKSGVPAGRRHTPSTSSGARPPIPAIVFHGDKDQTVHPRHGDHLIAGFTGPQVAASSRVVRGTSPSGRDYTRSVHHDGDGRVLAEQWVVHGAGHAWSGGQSSGSYTDASGPDATGEMLRFFFERPGP